MLGLLQFVLILSLFFWLLIAIFYSEAIHLNARKNYSTNLTECLPLIQLLGSQS